MQDLLVQSGLTQTQAEAYIYLLDNGPTTPPALARAVSLTRTNAYKVLDSLEELGLVIRQEVKKKIVYTPTDPSALATLVAEQRNRVTAIEQSVKQAMSQLRAKYRKSTAVMAIENASGVEAVVEAYETQAKTVEDIYFIKSRADIPFMGFETMDRLRCLTDKSGIMRYGITPDALEIPRDEEKLRTNLVRTRIPVESYTAPVEWSVSGDELLIFKFDGKGEYVRIQDAEIAESFRQVWKLASE